MWFAVLWPGACYGLGKPDLSRFEGGQERQLDIAFRPKRSSRVRRVLPHKSLIGPGQKKVAAKVFVRNLGSNPHAKCDQRSAARRTMGDGAFGKSPLKALGNLTGIRMIGFGQDHANSSPP